MSMSDELMILTIEKMQIELRRAMEDIELLSMELQRRTSPVQLDMSFQTASSEPVEPPQLVQPVKVKRVIKLKPKTEEVKKKPTGIVTWNAFLSQIRNEMQSLTEIKVKNEDVVAKATSTKLADPEVYKAFCADWLHTHYTE